MSTIDADNKMTGVQRTGKLGRTFGARVTWS